MPNPHLNAKVISRKQRKSAVAASSYRSGSKMKAKPFMKSAVAAAAYRSGEPLHDELAGKTYDYTRKEGVVHTELMFPENAPEWARSLSREQLWNKVEATEKRHDAQIARDVVASVPRELDREQQIALVREFVREQFTSRGMIADVAIHDKQASDGYSQPHVHIMLTMRELGPNGFGNKNREWNGDWKSKKKERATDRWTNASALKQWRMAWEECTNRHLAAAGRWERVSLESHRKRGIDREPQRYMGINARKQEKQGVRTRQGEKNRRIRRNTGSGGQGAAARAK